MTGKDHLDRQTGVADVLSDDVAVVDLVLPGARDDVAAAYEMAGGNRSMNDGH
jgi:hypothetical protein